MARLQHLIACLALLCLTGSSFGRVLQQLDATALSPPARLAPDSATALPLAPTPALSNTPLNQGPSAGPTSLPSAGSAQAPFPVAQACYVSYQAKINQQSSTSSSSVDSPACVVVIANMMQSQCQQLSQAQGRTFLATSDPACLYPVPEDCSGVETSLPGLNQCDSQITNGIQQAAQQGTFNQAVLANTPIGSSTPGFASPFDNMNMNFPSLGSNPFSGFGSSNPFSNSNPFG